MLLNCPLMIFNILFYFMKYFTSFIMINESLRILFKHIFTLCRPIPRIMPKIQNSETTQVTVNSTEHPEKNIELNVHEDEDQKRKPMFLFSIDYILNKAGGTNVKADTGKQNTQQFEWLYCTRFKPPKLDSK